MVPSRLAYDRSPKTDCCCGSLTRYAKLRVAYAPGTPWTFSPPPWVSDPDMHHDTDVAHVPWCMPWWLTSGFLWSRWRGKRSRHPRRMRNPQFCVSGKRPVMSALTTLEFQRWRSHWTLQERAKAHLNMFGVMWHAVKPASDNVDRVIISIYQRYTNWVITQQFTWLTCICLKQTVMSHRLIEHVFNWLIYWLGGETTFHWK